MNGKLCILVLASMYFIMVDAYTYIVPQKGLDHCLDASGKQHGKGETWFDDDKCERKDCSRDGDSLYISVLGCGIVAGPPHCKKVRGTGSYPDCCPTIKC